MLLVSVVLETAAGISTAGTEVGAGGVCLSVITGTCLRVEVEAERGGTFTYNKRPIQNSLNC